MGQTCDNTAYPFDRRLKCSGRWHMEEVECEK